MRELLLAGMIGLSLSPLPAAAWERPPLAVLEDMHVVECKFYNGSRRLPHDLCVVLTGAAFQLHKLAEEVHLPPDQLQNMCEADIGSRFPDEDVLVRRSTCHEIMRLTF